MPLTPQIVRDLAASYPVQYDNDYYFPHLNRARVGDVIALKDITKWKNSSASGVPMDFSRHWKKRSAWLAFSRRITTYLGGNHERLRCDFARRAPVWAMFWHHVLYGTPIFDINTHLALRFFRDGVCITRESARIVPGGHWQLYDEYCAWFSQDLRRLQNLDPSINGRTLDRALFMWGSKIKNT